MDRRFWNQLLLAFGLIFFFFVIGTIIFSAEEGWSLFDAFYFTGITLTSIGFGDIVPTTAVSKITTVIFGFLGIGLVFYSMNLVARKAFEQEADQLEAMTQKRIQHRLTEERKAKEATEKEAVELAKEVEKEAVKMAKEMTETKPVQKPKVRSKKK
ncbi:hypothetical protein GOV07_02215 [Candidatus Woesearchaeota archaeon]|nr:hypothetical protein [Candidatus Woesearchaeota archaeon]